MSAEMDSEDEEQQEFVAHLNRCISATDFKQLHENTSKFKNTVRKLLNLQSYMPGREFRRQANTLYKCCLKIVRDKHELHKRRLMGMNILDDIIFRADTRYITMDHVIHLTWAIMSCIHHFQLRLKTGAKGLVHYARSQRVDKCMESYSRLIRMFEPTMHKVILKSILTFYKEGKLWEIEFSCRDLIADLLTVWQNPGEAVSYTLDHIERVARADVTSAKYLVQVLYETLGIIRWVHMSERLMRRLLYMLESSIKPRKTDRFNYTPLRNGLMLCLRNAIKNLRNEDLMTMIDLGLTKLNAEFPAPGMECDTLSCLSNITVFASSRFRMTAFHNLITRQLLTKLLAFTHNYIMLGLRIWRNLIDRHKNSLIFNTPRIFFRGCNYKIKMKKCGRSDKLFFKSIARMSHQTTKNGFVIAEKRLDLELIFQTMALMLVEIPCGLTAGTYAATLIEVQEYAHKISGEDTIKSHYIHAIVISIMSLICYIHKADVFYEYVMSIMTLRAQWAPHLNPPLKSEYSYAQHYILWNKPAFFFEDWEARYGLWKCFRVKKKRKRYPNIASAVDFFALISMMQMN